MELKDIYDLWDRFEKSTVDEFELEMQGASLKLKKNQIRMGESVVIPQPTVENIAEPVEREKVNTNELAVKAPLVGTFYCAPTPNDAPFVAVGQTVKKGEVIGIIEAMKMMNEVTATVDGTVKEILVKDGDMVAYDQVLIVMENVSKS